MLRSADRHGIASSSKPRRIIVSIPRNTAPTSAAISCGVNGPRPPKRGATFAAVSASSSNQPARFAAHGRGDLARRTSRRRSSPAARARSPTAGRPRGSRRPAPTAATAASRRRRGGLALEQSRVLLVQHGQHEVLLASRSGSGSGSAGRRRRRRSAGSTARRTRCRSRAVFPAARSCVLVSVAVVMGAVPLSVGSIGRPNRAYVEPRPLSSIRCIRG